MAESLLLLSGRATGNPPTRESGQVGEFLTDLKGRLLVSPPDPLPVLGIVTGQLVAGGSALPIEVLDSATIVAHVKNVSNTIISSGNFLFEGSLNSTDGINGDWFQIQAQLSTSQMVTSAALSNIAAWSPSDVAWYIPVKGLKWARVRTVIAITATSIAEWMLSRSRVPTDLGVSRDTQPVSGTVGLSGTPTVLVSSLPTGTMLNRTTTASTNAASVKTTAARLYELTLSNPTATPAWLKLYSKNTLPVPGTDTPFAIFPIPANSCEIKTFGPVGKYVLTGLGMAVTGAVGAMDTTNAVAGIVVTGTYI